MRESFENEFSENGGFHMFLESISLDQDHPWDTPAGSVSGWSWWSADDFLGNYFTVDFFIVTMIFRWSACCFSMEDDFLARPEISWPFPESCRRRGCIGILVHDVVLVFTIAGRFTSLSGGN